MLKKVLKNSKGFTLVELLAVIVILGIIAGIAVPSIGGIIDNTKKDAHVANARQMIEAARMAYAGGLDLDDVSKLAGASSGDEGYKLETLISNGYLEEFNDPDQDTATGYKTAASYVLVEENATTGNLTFSVYLEGTDRKVGDSAPVLSDELDRSDVKDV